MKKVRDAIEQANFEYLLMDSKRACLEYKAEKSKKKLDSTKNEKSRSKIQDEITEIENERAEVDKFFEEFDAASVEPIEDAKESDFEDGTAEPEFEDEEESDGSEILQLFDDDEEEEYEEPKKKNIFKRVWSAIWGGVKKVAKKVWHFIKNVGYWICPWHWGKPRKKAEDEYDDIDCAIEDCFGSFDDESDVEDITEEEIPTTPEIAETENLADTTEENDTKVEGTLVPKTVSVPEDVAEESSEDEDDDDDEETDEEMEQRIINSLDSDVIKMFFEKDGDEIVLKDVPGANDEMRGFAIPFLGSSEEDMMDNLPEPELTEKGNNIYKICGDRVTIIASQKPYNGVWNATYLGVMAKTNTASELLHIIGLTSSVFDEVKRKNGMTIYINNRAGVTVTVTATPHKGKSRGYDVSFILSNVVG